MEAVEQKTKLSAICTISITTFSLQMSAHHDQSAQIQMCIHARMLIDTLKNKESLKVIYQLLITNIESLSGAVKSNVNHPLNKVR